MNDSQALKSQFWHLCNWLDHSSFVVPQKRALAYKPSAFLFYLVSLVYFEHIQTNTNK